MIKFFFSFVGIFVPFFCFSQEASLQILKVYSENYCTGTDLSIDVKVNGVFPANNKFTVVVHRDYNSSPEVWEYPAELKGNKVITNLKDPNLANYASINIKIVSSNPKTETEVIVFRALTKTKLKLATKAGRAADTLSSTDVIELGLTATPASPGEVTLNTGDKFQLAYGEYTTDKFTTLVKLPKTQEGIYTIKEASNACGPMEISGQVAVKVTSIDFFPISVFPLQICEGGEFQITYSVNGTNFDANTNFKVRITPNERRAGDPEFIDVPGVLNAKNIITAKFPTGFIPDDLGARMFRLAIVTTNPESISKTSAVQLNAYPKPSFLFTTETPSILIGQKVDIRSNLKGMPPFKLTLMNGQVVDYTWSVTPEKTTQYQVKTFESGCGVIENPPQPPFTITVRAGLFLGDIEGKSQIFCEGQSVKLPFIANGVNQQTSYVIQAMNETTIKYTFPAKVVDGKLEFVIPKISDSNPLNNYDNITGLRLVSANPTMTAQVKYYQIQSKPNIGWAENSAKSVPYPSAIRMDYALTGGKPYELEFTDGSRQNVDDNHVWYYQFIKRDTTFKVSALSNSCFRNSEQQVFPLKVTKPDDTTPSLYLQYLKSDFCLGDSIEVEAFINGKFDAGNEFTISYLSFGQVDQHPLFKITKPGRYKVKIPYQNYAPFDASLMLSSSLPRLISETPRFYFRTKPSTPRIWQEGTKTNPAQISNYTSPSWFNLSSNPFTTINYAVEGIAMSGVTDFQGDLAISALLPPNKVAEIKVSSASNTCGTYNEPVYSYAYLREYRIEVYNYDLQSIHCAGTQYQFPFRVTEGPVAPGTIFTLQISDSGNDNSFKDVVTTSAESRTFSFSITDKPAGTYYFRIKSSTGVVSDRFSIRIGAAPTATFKSLNGEPMNQNVSVDYGTPLYIYTWLTGNDPWELVYSDGVRSTANGSPTGYTLVVNTPQTFSINKFWNSCGYGTSNSSVNVKIKPTLVLSYVPENSAAVVCAGQTLDVGYKLAGVESIGGDYLVFSMLNDKGVRVKLDSTQKLDVRISLKIPAVISGNTFQIQATLASFQLTKSLRYQAYITPDITLFGDNTIAPGQTAKLYVRANSNFAANTSFELSDGSVYTHTNPYVGQVMEIEVKPKATITYSLNEIKSSCGTGKVSGSATITIEERKAEWINPQSVSGLRKSSICDSDTLLVYFYHLGSTGGNPKYQVSLSDSLGKNFVAISTLGDASPVRAVVPAGTKASEFYRIKIATTDPNVTSGIIPDRVKIYEYAHAKVLTPEVFYESGKRIEVVIELKGTPWYYYRYGDANSLNARNVATNLDTLRFNPLSAGVTYKILDVQNVCGYGKLDDPSSFRIELITATEPVAGSEIVKFGSNPTDGVVTIWFEKAASRQLSIVNMQGQSVASQNVLGNNAVMDLRMRPAGLYILEVKSGKTKTSYRVIKY